MPAQKMHAEEVDIDIPLVRRLLEAQFPQWADLPLERLESFGTDNAMFRIGSEMVARLPRVFWVVDMLDKEQDWLPKLAPHLPLAVPLPLAQGMPGEGYAWRWSIYRWLEGENATLERLADPDQAATDLAQFITALHRIDAVGGPPPGDHNNNRGVPLAERDARTHAAIAQLDGVIDTEAATAAWEAALQTPHWDNPPVWIHGDIQSGNLLAHLGRLSAVIDFGCLGVGDPACDLQVAWNLFTPQTRQVFRAALEVDDATWARGRGWALSVGLIALPYYLTTNPGLVRIARYAIDQAFAEHQSGA
jgi:aminoglycoside phosphotransferase (APT) family kinase protein